ncbi:MAG TPA: alpha/beta fold hydrolase [Candidatus Limnocylindrales bacterium]|nr:alpha/beta fold hydrolase [Candidatus Limnocylindrales bacterium]
MTPDQYTLQETMLDVGDGHTLYVHDWGQADATNPILFLHGGPGGQCKDSHKQFFDGSRQRVIFFDQRGSGKSTPYGSLEHNTTEKLVADIVKVLDTIGIEKVIITGGSWGSCLALAMAIEHLDRVSAMVLHGIFTGRRSEISWLDEGRFRMFYPDAWDAYCAATPEAHRKNPSPYHFERILGTDAEALKQSAYAYESLEGSVVKLDDRFEPQPFEDYDPAGIRIETHYMQHRCFMEDGYIMDNAPRMTMPVYLVQGRYDMVCPPTTAYELSKRLPNSELIWTTGGHAAERESWNVMRTLLRQLTREAA